MSTYCNAPTISMGGIPICLTYGTGVVLPTTKMVKSQYIWEMEIALIENESTPEMRSTELH